MSKNDIPKQRLLELIKDLDKIAKNTKKLLKKYLNDYGLKLLLEQDEYVKKELRGYLNE